MVGDIEAATAWPDVVLAITSAVTALMVVVAASYARHQLDEIRRTRNADVMFRLSERWDRLSEDRRLLYQYEGRGRKLRAHLLRAMDKNSKLYFDLVRVPSFFEDLAIQVRARSIPPDMVDASFGTAIQTYWKIWAPAVDVVRRQDERVHEKFQALAKEMADVEKQQRESKS
ncbi:MAG TPA: hypothetical protein VHI71_06415 [Actinomycetota bacterium]|nr:hypothetical protein [Actinomycetota bacterium]